MKLRLFAAIDVGSYELTCKIFEYSVKNGMKEVEVIRYALDLGTEIFEGGKTVEIPVTLKDIPYFIKKQ